MRFGKTEGFQMENRILTESDDHEMEELSNFN